MTDQKNRTRTMRPVGVAARHSTARARIDSWWRLPTGAEADEAARIALEAMPSAEGLIQFSVHRSPEEPALFLQSLWTSVAARDHYVRNVAATASAAVDDRAPNIARDRLLTEIVHVIDHTDRIAEAWVTRRLPAQDTAGARALAQQEDHRLRAEPSTGLVRASVGIGRGEAVPVEIVVVEEWAGPVPTDGPAYRPFGAVEPTT
jgi:quinol monooxygenase YgiN